MAKTDASTRHLISEELHRQFNEEYNKHNYAKQTIKQHWGIYPPSINMLLRPYSDKQAFTKKCIKYIKDFIRVETHIGVQEEEIRIPLTEDIQDKVKELVKIFSFSQLERLLDLQSYIIQLVVYNRMKTIKKELLDKLFDFYDRLEQSNWSVELIDELDKMSKYRPMKDNWELRTLEEAIEENKKENLKKYKRLVVGKTYRYSPDSEINIRVKILKEFPRFYLATNGVYKFGINKTDLFLTHCPVREVVI